MKGKSVFHSSCSFRCFLLSFFFLASLLSSPCHFTYLFFSSLLFSLQVPSLRHFTLFHLSYRLFSSHFGGLSAILQSVVKKWILLETKRNVWKGNAVQNGDEKNQLFPWYVGETSQSFHLHCSSWPGATPMTHCLDLQAPSSCPWPSAARHHGNTTQRRSAGIGHGYPQSFSMIQHDFRS